MKPATKAILAVLFVGACANAIKFNNYKEVFDLTTTILLILVVWYNERKK